VPLAGVARPDCPSCADQPAAASLPSSTGSEGHSIDAVGTLLSTFTVLLVASDSWPARSVAAPVAVCSPSVSKVWAAL
jgi:hypothetical protein